MNPNAQPSNTMGGNSQLAQTINQSVGDDSSFTDNIEQDKKKI
jgi:hypothetical protein